MLKHIVNSLFFGVYELPRGRSGFLADQLQSNTNCVCLFGADHIVHSGFVELEEWWELSKTFKWH